jgi:hypothetical protein
VLCTVEAALSIFFYINSLGTLNFDELRVCSECSVDHVLLQELNKGENLWLGFSEKLKNLLVMEKRHN